MGVGFLTAPQSLVWSWATGRRWEFSMFSQGQCGFPPGSQISSNFLPVGGLVTQNCECVHDALRLTCVPFMVYSCLVPRVPRIDSTMHLPSHLEKGNSQWYHCICTCLIEDSSPKDQQDGWHALCYPITGPLNFKSYLQHLYNMSRSLAC